MEDILDNYNNDFIQYSKEKVKDETKHLALYFTIHIALYIVLLFFLIFFAWYTVFVTTHKFYAVSGPSMKYTLNRQIDDHDTKSSFDAVYVDKFTKAKLFDIVVIEKPNSDSVIKRLMATEGDYITIAKGTNALGEECYYYYRIPKGSDLESFTDEQARLDEESGNLGYQIRGYDDWFKNVSPTIDINVVVNEETFSHQYEYNFFATFLDGYETNEKFNYHISNDGLIYVQVPQGQIFYMGDNRGHSTDARERGFTDEKYIFGRTEFIVYNYNFGNRLWEVVKFYFNEMEEFFAR